MTVRRATLTPWRAISSTISSSDIGFSLSSLAMTSSSFCLIVSQAISSPSAVVVPPPKNRLSGKDPARGLNPLVVDGPADGRDVHADLVGDLLHLERLDEFGAAVENVLLMLDDRLGDPEQRVSSLLDRLDEPAGRLDLLLDEVAGRLIGVFVAELLEVIARDGQLGCVLVGQAHFVHALVGAFDDQVGNDVVGVLDLERAARPQIQPLEVLEGVFDLLERDSRFFLDHRQAVVLEIVEMLRDQDLEHVVTGHLGVELQKQALAQVACADTWRVEPLNELQAPARLVRRWPCR